MAILTPEELDRDLTQAFGELCSVFSEGMAWAGWREGWEDEFPQIVKHVLTTNEDYQVKWVTGEVVFTFTVQQAKLVQSFADLLGHWVTFNMDTTQGYDYLPYTPLSQKAES